MDATRPKTSRATLAVAHLLAQLLERLERSTLPVGAEQYRSVARHLADELGELHSHTAMSALLDAYPAAAQLYENLNYRHAGLCRSRLDLSLDAELRARQLIERAKGGPIAALR